jgi:hypothetical protein
MTDRYLPVPVWNNRIGQWEPSISGRGSALPHGRADLILPAYQCRTIAMGIT